MKKLQEMEPRTVALLIALTIGLGIALHEVFFLVALAIAFVAGVRVICEHAKLTHRHL